MDTGTKNTFEDIKIALLKVSSQESLVHRPTWVNLAIAEGCELSWREKET